MLLQSVRPLLFTLFIASFLFCSFNVSAKTSEFLSFKDWKSGQIKVAQNALERSNDTLKKAKVLVSAQGLVAQFKMQVQHDRWSLEAAQELTVTDYLVIYLSQNQDKAKFLQVAGQLNQSEIAEVLEAFESSLSFTQKVDKNQAVTKSASLTSK